RVTSGPALERAGDLASILTNLEPKDILFIDEIHRINKVVEETLYSAMEDYCLDIVIGKGPAARTVRLDLPRFTIVGATTRIGLLSSPLRDRFGVILRMELYTPEELCQIINQSAKKLNLTIENDAVMEIAKRSRGTPRIAIRLLKRVRDVAQVKGNTSISINILQESLQLLDIDHQGLDSSDRRLLITLIEKFNGGPVGIETLAAALSEDMGTIEEVIEPYLIQKGLIKRTPRGRVATIEAFRHLGKSAPSHINKEALFNNE
ncbi:MAG: Holliday junction branch migration DNA helicase RuvB, partial [Patescibacteria group bacterium]|nr:Holliday junction branch migration DNA helicase RuvB [Patescibacteria group bacterium]